MVSGFVVDGSSGEPLPGVHVYEPARQAGTLTNRFGFFSLTLPPGAAAVRFSFIGYETTIVRLDLTRDTSLTVPLAAATTALEEVEVVASAELSAVDEAQMSTIRVPLAQIKKLPVLLGEVDVLKTLQLLPGVKAGHEGASSFYVRGGGSDQNLILMDGAYLYNPNHLFGFFSIFNTDALKQVDLIKGGFPARYGGRLSSVVDLKLKEGDKKAFHTEGAVGLVASRLTVEGPLARDRASFMLSARRTYVDLLLLPFQRSEEKLGYAFYDVHASANTVLSPRDRMHLSLYAGRDRFGISYRSSRSQGGAYTSKGALRWGNVMATLRWNHLFGPRLFGNVLLGYTSYGLQVRSEDTAALTTGAETEESLYRSLFVSSIRDVYASIDLDYLPDPRHTIKVGVHAVLHRFAPGATQEHVSSADSLQDLSLASRRVPAGEWALYGEDEIRLTSFLSANVGARLAGLIVNGRAYASFQPRVSGRVSLGGDRAVKVSYAAMQQYIHLLTNNGVGLPTDLWLPATDRVPPQQAHQVAVGFLQALSQRAYDITIEAYYKTLEGLVEYEEGASFLNATAGEWQDRVTRGKGRAYGVEILVRKHRGQTTGWAGYTLSRATRTFAELNGGAAFPAHFDRLHDVSLALTHRFSERLDLGVVWVYSTGSAAWLPSGSFQAPYHETGYLRPNPQPHTAYVYGPRNASRLAPYHRLDVHLSFHRPSTRGHHTFVVGAYNLYNRQNAFFLYPHHTDLGLRYRKVTLFPILPTLTYRFKF